MSDRKNEYMGKIIAKIGSRHANRGNSYSYSLDNSAEQVNILFSWSCGSKVQLFRLNILEKIS